MHLPRSPDARPAAQRVGLLFQDLQRTPLDRRAPYLRTLPGCDPMVRCVAFLTILLAGCRTECWNDPYKCPSPTPSSKSYSPEELRAGHQRAVARYAPACERRDASACELVAIAKRALGAPASELEPVLATACEAGLARSTGDGIRPCREAGSYAEARGAPDAARARYERGCALGDGSACSDAARLEPARALALWSTACRFGDFAACLALANTLLDPASAAPDPERGRALLVRACVMLRHDGACARLGEAEARRW